MRLTALERAEELVRGEIRPSRRPAPGASANGATPRCCAACGAPASRRYGARSSPRSRLRWPGSPPRGTASTAMRAVRRKGRGRADAARRRTRPAARGARTPAGTRPHAGDLGARRAATPARQLRPHVARPVVRRGRGRVDRRGQRLGPRRARGALLPRGRAVPRASAGAFRRAARPACHDALRERLGRRRGVLVGPAGRPRRLAGRPARRTVGPGVGGRGHERCVRAAARAAPVARAAGRVKAGRRRGASAPAAADSQPQLQGRWSLTRGLFEPRPSEKERAQARAELLLRAPRAGRTRDGGRGAGARAGSRPCTRSCRRWRRLAPRGAATSSRASAARSSRYPRRSSGCARIAMQRKGRSCWRPRIRPTSTARCCRGRGAEGRRAVPHGCRAPTL